MDTLLADAEASGAPIDGPDGLLAQITKSVLERALDVEITDHLAYERGDPTGYGWGNPATGTTARPCCLAGPVELEVPHDGNGSFDPVIVPKRDRRLGEIEDLDLVAVCPRQEQPRDITEHPGGGLSRKRRGGPRWPATEYGATPPSPDTPLKLSDLDQGLVAL